MLGSYEELPITFDDVREAARRLKGIAHRTPVMTSRIFDGFCGYQVFFKCENLQRGGAFKFRGAYNTLAQLSSEKKKAGVVAYSSGNHAQGVAYAARLLGIPATIVMPTDAPKSKLHATEEYGAEIRFYDRQRDDRAQMAAELAEERGAALVPPFDHPHIMAGQGTAGLELLEEVPDLDVMVTPIGGGGLLSGCATAAKGLRPDIRICGVETAASNDWWQSVRAGRRIEIAPPETIADGMRTTKPGKLTFAVRHLIEDVLLVGEDEVVETLRILLTRMKILAEPTGAVAPAAVLHKRVGDEGLKVGVIISGGNIDPPTLCQLLFPS
ncbi:MAG TPA: pyridoxal-phosphate dependent enzyme [Acidobacteriota bacterium]|nr:pyridoxal-phosphate dependent enzyme [Acidobacteriota bacterium]